MKKRKFRIYKKIWKRNQCPHCRADLTIKGTVNTDTFYEGAYLVEYMARCANCRTVLCESSYGNTMTWFDWISYRRGYLNKRNREFRLDNDFPF